MGTHSPYPLGTNQKLINKILLKVNHNTLKINFFLIDKGFTIMYNTYCDLVKLQSQTCPLGGMVNTSPSQGEDYGFDPRSGYQKIIQG